MTTALRIPADRDLRLKLLRMGCRRRPRHTFIVDVPDILVEKVLPLIQSTFPLTISVSPGSPADLSIGALFHRELDCYHIITNQDVGCNLPPVWWEIQDVSTGFNGFVTARVLPVPSEEDVVERIRKARDYVRDHGGPR